ncbi:MAG: permease-like cell division protein FtsX [Coriobacteriales bacterium]|jgi:cell division transport system permease protein|nr:permease-like cell division protein FtsX [Coriobacteriales bacterium]
MRSFFYFIKEALGNSKKNFGTTFGAVVTIFLSLLVIGVFMTVSMIVDKTVQGVESQVSISIWLSDNANQTDVTELRTFINNMDDVQSVAYVSKDEAMTRFIEMTTKEGTDIVDQLDGNPMPASLEVELAVPENVQSVVDRILEHPTLKKVIGKPDNPLSDIRYGSEVIDKLFAASNVIRIVCLVLVILLIFVALVFINNTIRLAILARRKEIAIMRLVGASNGFIRGPFLMEGALQALVGAGLAILCIWALVSNLLPMLKELLNWLPTDYTTMHVWAIYLLLLGVGLLIGLFGSAWAMRRYLRV